MKAFLKYITLTGLLGGIAWLIYQSRPDTPGVLEKPLSTAVPTHLVRKGESAYTVIIAPEATLAERHVAEEFIRYFKRITGVELPLQQGGTASAAIYIGSSPVSEAAGIDESKMSEEEWVIRSHGPHLLLTGGRPRGTLYAVYQFLENELGVRWWSPWEESVPERSEIARGNVNRTGKPAFFYRDIFRTFSGDRGRFAARNRLNRQGSEPISPEYGGGIDFGPPQFCHTFYHYFPAKDYFANHPEWYALVDGKRRDKEAQLCLTNPELRAQFLEKLRENIKTSHAEATARNLPPPPLFAVDQNDYDNYCQCPECSAIAKREGSDSGPILEFVNWLGESIETEYPDVYLVTLAYHQSEKPPKNVRPRKNVFVRLTDTTSSVIHPNDHPFNYDFLNKLNGWAEKADSLLIWDYGVTYSEKTKDWRHASGVPLPTLHTMQRDYQLMHARNVKGIMVEYEFPILSDFRDLKLWVMCKLLENPFQDANALIQEFTSGFYGKAAPAIREYLVFLEQAALERNEFIDWFAPIHRHGYLTLDFFIQAHALFTAAEAAVEGEPERLLRVRHARLGLDRATIVCQRRILNEWLARAPESRFANFPLDMPAIGERMKTTWEHFEKNRKSHYPSEQPDQRERLHAAAMRFREVAIPEPFRKLPRESFIHITPDEMRGHHGTPSIARDPEAPYGWVMRWEATPEQIEEIRKAAHQDESLMPCGVYDIGAKKSLLTSSIRREEVKGPGYHWYQIGQVQFETKDVYVYAMRKWHLQADLEGIDLSRPYEVWINAKFEGPGFLVSGSTGLTTISVDRIVVAEAK